MSLKSIERNIANGIKTIKKILAGLTALGLTIALLFAYFTGNLEYLMEWFSNWLVNAVIFSVIIIMIAAFLGLISPKIAKAIRDMSDF